MISLEMNDSCVYIKFCYVTSWAITIYGKYGRRANFNVSSHWYIYMWIELYHTIILSNLYILQRQRRSLQSNTVAEKQQLQTDIWKLVKTLILHLLPCWKKQQLELDSCYIFRGNQCKVTQSMCLKKVRNKSNWISMWPSYDANVKYTNQIWKRFLFSLMQSTSEPHTRVCVNY